MLLAAAAGREAADKASIAIGLDEALVQFRSVFALSSEDAGLFARLQQQGGGSVVGTEEERAARALTSGPSGVPRSGSD